MQKLHSLQTNFKKLDKITGGFFPGELTVIGARPSVGKTSFLCSLIKQITLDSGSRGLFFSLEMPVETFRIRMVSSMARIPVSKIRAGELNENEEKCCERLVKQIQDLPLDIIDKADLNINELCAVARKLCKKKDIKIIYIDYLGLITTDDGNQPIYDQVACIIKKLKVLARELNIPIVILSQVAHDSAGNPPVLNQIRGSGEIEAVSDVVLLLHRDASKQSNSAKLFVAKNHNGTLGSVDFAFYPEIVTFEEPE